MGDIEYMVRLLNEMALRRASISLMCLCIRAFYRLTWAARRAMLHRTRRRNSSDMPIQSPRPVRGAGQPAAGACEKGVRYILPRTTILGHRLTQPPFYVL